MRKTTGRRATKRIELDRVNNATLPSSKEMCPLNWQRHNEIRNKIAHCRSMCTCETVTVMKTDPCDTLRNAKPTKENLVQVMTSKRRKHAVCEENSNREFRDGKNKTKSGEAYTSKVKSHTRNKICQQ